MRLLYGITKQHDATTGDPRWRVTLPDGPSAPRVYLGLYSTIDTALAVRDAALAAPSLRGFATELRNQRREQRGLLRNPPGSLEAARAVLRTNRTNRNASGLHPSLHEQRKAANRTIPLEQRPYITTGLTRDLTPTLVYKLRLPSSDLAADGSSDLAADGAKMLTIGTYPTLKEAQQATLNGVASILNLAQQQALHNLTLRAGEGDPEAIRIVNDPATDSTTIPVTMPPALSTALRALGGAPGGASRPGSAPDSDKETSS